MADQAKGPFYASECDLCEADGHLHVWECPNNPLRTTSAEYDGISEWMCSECGHVHTGRQWAYIVLGCPCGYVPDHPLVTCTSTPDGEQ